eukprot:PhM_4_TR17630/c0_g1_i1/m.63373
MLRRSWGLLERTVVTAATFDHSVLGTELAVLLTYHTESAMSGAYTAMAEGLVDKMNEGKKNRWIRYCTIDADQQPALASAFAVQRQKTPVSFFVMGGTIIDRLTGNTEEPRLRGCLDKFYAHYCNVKGITEEAQGDVASDAVDMLGAMPRKDLTGSGQGAVDESIDTLVENVFETPMKDLEKWPKVWEVAHDKTSREVRRLFRALRLHERSLPEDEVRSSFYDKPNVQHLVTLYILRVHQAAVAQNDLALAQKYLAELQHDSSSSNSVDGGNMKLLTVCALSRDVAERYARAQLEVDILLLGSLKADAARDLVKTTFFEKRSYDVAVEGLVELLRPAKRVGVPRETIKAIIATTQHMMTYLGSEHPTTTRYRQKLNALMF